MALKGVQFGDPSSYTEIDARRLQQLADFRQSLLSPQLISFVIGIIRHSGHGNHQRLRQTVFLSIHFHYTPLIMSRQGHGSAFHLLSPLDKSHWQMGQEILSGGEW
jgi:hypothetical protein